MLRLLFISAFSFLWTLSYGQLSIQEVESKALEHNRAILTQKAQVDASEWSTQASRSLWLPQLSLQAESQWTQRPKGESKPHFFSSAILQLDQVIFTPEVFYGVREQAIQEGLEKELLKETELLTLFHARRLFYEIAFAQDQVANYEEQVRVAAEVVQNERQRKEYGQATKLDLSQKQVLLAEQIQNLDQAKASLKQRQESLQVLLGDTPNAALFPKIDHPLGEKKYIADWLTQRVFVNKNEEKILSYVNQVEQSIKEGELQREEIHSFFADNDFYYWEQKALEKQPQIAEQRKTIALAENATEQAKGGYLPSLSFTVQAGSPPLSPAGPTPLSGNPVKHVYASGTVNLNWSIFSSFLTQRQVAAQRSLTQASKIDLQQLLATVQQSVRSQMYLIEESFYNLLASYESLNLAKLSVKQALLENQVGSITALELRQVVEDYGNVWTAYNQARLNLLIHYAKLLYLAGEYRTSIAG